MLDQMMYVEIKFRDGIVPSNDEFDEIEWRVMDAFGTWGVAYEEKWGWFTTGAFMTFDIPEDEDWVVDLGTRHLHLYGWCRLENAAVYKNAFATVDKIIKDVLSK